MAKTSPLQFIREVRQETSRVTWPTRKETMLTTAMVLVMASVAGIFFFVADAGLAKIVQIILGLGD
jgi:preprotein translocase subunit SecE